jgi:hypothetical protein
MDLNSKSVAAGVNSGPATVHGAIGVAGQVGERLWASVSLAEKLAEALDGPGPEGTDASSGAASGPVCMADYLTQVVDGLHTPATRIEHALERIKRRLG